jgi:hypothetical protein
MHTHPGRAETHGSALYCACVVPVKQDERVEQRNDK